ncbi:MAG: hypothetical protein ACQERR_04410 [Pseudomonadota bacterium]
MTFLLLVPGVLTVLAEIILRGSFDLILIAGGFNLAAGAATLACLHWAPRWATAAALVWAGATLGVWLLYQLVVFGLPTSTFTALSAAIGAALSVPVVVAWLRGRRFTDGPCADGSDG